jgi:hypothetical protein
VGRSRGESERHRLDDELELLAPHTKTYRTPGRWEDLRQSHRRCGSDRYWREGQRCRMTTSGVSQHRRHWR